MKGGGRASSKGADGLPGEARPNRRRPSTPATDCAPVHCQPLAQYWPPPRTRPCPNPRPSPARAPVVASPATPPISPIARSPSAHPRLPITHPPPPGTQPALRVLIALKNFPISDSFLVPDLDECRCLTLFSVLPLRQRLQLRSSAAQPPFVDDGRNKCDIESLYGVCAGTYYARNFAQSCASSTCARA